MRNFLRPGSHDDRAALDRPWHRPGAARYALTRLRQVVRSAADAYEPGPGAVLVDSDVAVPTRDGTVLRANVHRPPGEGLQPVLLCAHPYGNDNVPRPRHRGGFSLPFQYRALRQTARARFSSLTSWEAPDPAWWTAQGFVVVDADLRGSGHSDGVGSLAGPFRTTSSSPDRWRCGCSCRSTEPTTPSCSSGSRSGAADGMCPSRGPTVSAATASPRGRWCRSTSRSDRRRHCCGWANRCGWWWRAGGCGPAIG